MDYVWDFGFVFSYRHVLLRGLLNTIYLFGVCFFFSLLIGLVVGIMRTSRGVVFPLIGAAYVEGFRNVPSLILLFWFYYMIPVVTGWQLSVWIAASVALSLYSGAYCAEIYRAGIEAVDKGQWEGSKALGFGRVGQLFYIILPQAIPRMIPAFTNRSIEMMKTTTIASTLAYGELLYQAKILGESEYRPLEAYTSVAIIFIIIILPMTYISTRLEEKLKEENR